MGPLLVAEWHKKVKKLDRITEAVLEDCVQDKNLVDFSLGLKAFSQPLPFLDSSFSFFFSPSISLFTSHFHWPW